MDLNLKNKVIIVTGGSKGIGNGICNLLAEEGAIPVIVGRNKANILDAVKIIKNNGGQAFHCFAELTDQSACKKAIDRVLKEFGRIDGLVNNAGVNDGVGLENGNYDHFMISIQRNVAHYYAMAKYALPALKKSKGAIVNIGSKTSFTGQGGTSGYAAANGARNAVIVAEFYTPLYKKWLDTFPNPEEKINGITKNIPLENRMTSTTEITNTVAFLLSKTSSHTTGQLLFVDGGYTHLDRSI
jgi:L-fucose dehydrogenase